MTLRTARVESRSKFSTCPSLSLPWLLWSPVLPIDSGAPVPPLAAVASPDSRDPLAGEVSRHSGVKAVEHVAKKNVKEKGA